MVERKLEGWWDPIMGVLHCAQIYSFDSRLKGLVSPLTAAGPPSAPDPRRLHLRITTLGNSSCCSLRPALTAAPRDRDALMHLAFLRAAG